MARLLLTPCATVPSSCAHREVGPTPGRRTQACRQPSHAPHGAAVSVIGVASVLCKLGCRRRTRTGAVCSVAPKSSRIQLRAAGIAGFKDVHFWQWRGQRIGYRADGPPDGQPLVLIHGFALSSIHFRHNIPSLADAGYRVYAIDLLGFGASAKPVAEYSTELWEELVADFCDAFSPDTPAILVGNSIGSLVVMRTAASLWGRSMNRVRAMVLINCAGGMNSKGTLSNDSVPLPIRMLLFPAFLFLDIVLQLFGRAIFDRLRQRDNLSETLKGLYVNKEAVDHELVDGILAPSADETSFDVFLRVLTGDPGEIPAAIMPNVNCPTLCLWGDEDTATPLWGDVGRMLQQMAADPLETHVSLQVFHGGHFLQDDAPGHVNAAILSWLKELPSPRHRSEKRIGGDDPDEHLDLDDILP